MPAAQASPMARQRNGLMVKGGAQPTTSTTVFRIVNEATRPGRRRRAETDRAADVVYDEVEPLKAQDVDGAGAEPPEAAQL